jgi:hypothetical protein
MLLCGLKCWTMNSLYAFKCKYFRNTTQWHLEYDSKALFEAPCITSGSRIEPELSQAKLGAFYYIMTVQNTVHFLWINLYKLSKL